jgi:hypothetical protein
MVELKQFINALPSEVAREQFALACGTSLGHLRNACSGLRTLHPEVCTQAEIASGGAVRRWHLREDWPRIWPELIGVKGAPRVSASKRITPVFSAESPRPAAPVPRQPKQRSA